ncbi:MAG: tRNA adenylyltransferase (CCA-adding enzyme), tRNA nucleotidyltransferase CCA-adding enzyme [archaeon GW2011_AR3]|nr:MAG: tRNA adenylyltransferase (CCA-adding enzyme), tRNA nucleotidyltransferase CCA-adding enzyme [archaeon GW2011_AR3]MBS3108923.1 nucleotidyltransferase domain-containing protein [Candidatus Woesearchaeota archaeon]
MKKMGFLRDIADEIVPDMGIYKHVDAMLDRINSRIRKLKVRAKAVAGGSIAKNNFIRHDHDIDLFVKFDKKYKSEELSDYLAKILSGMRAERIHGSRDYFRIRNGHNFEIVPVMDIRKGPESQNVTDMSPLHVNWVNAITRKNPKLLSEIRLTKQFCKAQGVYGAESYIRGFSGHVIDIITLHYGGFLPLARNASKWKPGQVVDYHNVYKGKARQVLNESKLGPLIVIDPIMPERNASAALSEEKFQGFISACDRFLGNPSKQFFQIAKVTPETLRMKHKGKKVFCFSISLVDGKEDVVGARLARGVEFMSRQAEKYGFKLAASGFAYDRKTSGMAYFVMNNDALPSKMVLQGPPLASREHVARFKKVHRKTYVKGKSIYAIENRKMTKFSDYALFIARDKFFKDKIKKFQLAK